MGLNHDILEKIDWNEIAQDTDVPLPPKNTQLICCGGRMPTGLVATDKYTFDSYFLAHNRKDNKYHWKKI